MKLRIHAIDKQKTDYVMACTTEISYAANTIKKLHIQSPLDFDYHKNLYRDKQKEMGAIFD